MRNKTLDLIAGVAIAAFAGSALAQITAPGPKAERPDSTMGAPSGDEFTKLDADKDGKVSKKEADKNKKLAAKWSTLDVNKDGQLDQAEFAAFESEPK